MSCCQPPDIIYFADFGPGFIALQLNITSNISTFSLPCDLNQTITFTLTLTNIGNVGIQAPRLIYTNLSGIIQSGSDWLNPGQSESIQVNIVISNYPKNIEISGYGYIDFGCELLLSKPVNNIVVYDPNGCD